VTPLPEPPGLAVVEGGVASPQPGGGSAVPSAAKLCAAGCGALVPPGPGRSPGQDWWCQARLCQAERLRRTHRRHNRKRGRKERVPTACENCGKAAFPVPGISWAGVFCSRPPCRRAYGRRVYALAKDAAEREGKPC
jgi:hypothetical protein